MTLNNYVTTRIVTDRQLQSAALLSLLGDDTAEAVLAHMRPEIADEIRAKLGDDEQNDLNLREKREVMEETGLTVSPESLTSFSHWTTPDQMPQRFATWFFIAEISSTYNKVLTAQEVQRVFRPGPL